MIRLMEKEPIRILMELSMRDYGNSINKMARVKRYGQMVQFLLENTYKGKSTEKGGLNGLMVLNTKVISTVISFMEKVIKFKFREILLG
jgi:hypothetical protein